MAQTTFHHLPVTVRRQANALQAYMDTLRIPPTIRTDFMVRLYALTNIEELQAIREEIQQYDYQDVYC
jgi:hypothetical protein